MTAIETTGLTKQYGDVTAVADLDLVVEEGTVFGILGSNGAGKSTLINCVLDYLRPTQGRISVLGHDAQAESLAVRQRTGVLPEGVAVYDRLTGRQHLQFAIDSHEASDDPGGAHDMREIVREEASLEDLFMAYTDDGSPPPDSAARPETPATTDRAQSSEGSHP